MIGHFGNAAFYEFQTKIYINNDFFFCINRTNRHTYEKKCWKKYLNSFSGFGAKADFKLLQQHLNPGHVAAPQPVSVCLCVFDTHTDTHTL